MKTIRNLHLVGATGQIRTATYDNREHLVVPVVAMVEGVVWAMNSDVPEFVPAEELAETPQQWNGRGCFAGHPADGGTQITANTPRTLEKSFGIVFDAVDSKQILLTRRLEFCAWIDPAKAEAVGPEAADVVRRLRDLQDGTSTKSVEVSVGCYVEAEDVDGEYDGRQYHGVWRNIVSDHLAFLAAGEKGACSVAMGCGAGRQATRHLITAEGIRREDSMATPATTPKSTPPAGTPTPQPTGPKPSQPTGPKRGIKDRFAQFLQSIRGAEINESDRDVRRNLDDALRAVEPGYMGIDEVYPDGSDDLTSPYVVYSVMPADEWHMFRRTYTLAGDVVTLGAAPEKVEQVTTYQPVTAAAAAQPCSCGGQQARNAGSKPTQEGITVDKAARIKLLMESEHNPFKDQKALEAADEKALVALEAHCANAKTLKDAADKLATDKAAVDGLDGRGMPAPKAAAAEAPKPLTRAEILAADPSIASIVAQHEAREAREKTELKTQLKVAAAGVYTEDELDKMSVGELSKLATLAKVETTVDYSGRGTPRVPAKAEDYTPPDPYAADLERRVVVKH